IAMNNNVPWLGFALDGKRLLIAKRPIRYNCTWSELNNRNVVYGTPVTIKAQQWLVRLLKGARSDPSPTGIGVDPVGSYGSEWNRLLYRVSGQMSSVSGEGIPFGEWAQFTDAELGLGATH